MDEKQKIEAQISKTLKAMDTPQLRNIRNALWNTLKQNPTDRDTRIIYLRVECELYDREG